MTAVRLELQRANTSQEWTQATSSSMMGIVISSYFLKPFTESTQIKYGVDYLFITVTTATTNVAHMSFDAI
uniref:Uncharacterized protein n=1 Tax=Glossina palpalis gambiensis TaxID=67801 RepID=A0A1B0BQY6_9MUSC